MAVHDLTTIDEIYIDESSQTKHRFLLLGGIIIHGEHGRPLEEALSAARLPELPNGEMGWVKVSRTKLEAYRRIVDLFFDNPHEFSPFEFHSLVVDTHHIKDKLFNEGSRSIGFNKEIFQLCMKFARIHKGRNLYIYPDHRETDQQTSELRLILNRAIRKKNDQRDWPFRRVHMRDSSKVQALQLVDILLGSIAFRLNGHREKPEASPAKAELSDHILQRAHIADVTQDTWVRGKFTIWHRILK